MSGFSDLPPALNRQAAAGLKPVIEELVLHGANALVTIHIPGLARVRARRGDDRNYEVLTLERGKTVAMRACRNRSEARLAAGID